MFSTLITKKNHSSEHVFETFAILKHVRARLASTSPSPPAPVSFVGDCTTWSKTGSSVSFTRHYNITSSLDRAKQKLLPRKTADYVHILLFPTSLLQPGCKPRRQTSNGAVFGREEKLCKRSGCLTITHQVSIHFQFDSETTHPIRISSLVSLDLHKYSHFMFSIPNPSKPHLMQTAVDIGLGRLPSGNPEAIFLASVPPPRRRRQQISCHYGWGREGSSAVCWGREAMLGQRGHARSLRVFAWALGNRNGTKSSKHLLMERDTWTTRQMRRAHVRPYLP